ncbi:transmembrane 192 isoform X1 [Pelobates cultripes]|uniref:Transmembrane protein 192 n=1 Tax=Pelobates cultripes TaxID=61616 RepID=A0AAD1WDT0_PELCU|nr:transmembrane 192 isoform X1 [Pelobates cultripes]
MPPAARAFHESRRMERGRRLLLESSGELTQSADEECLIDATLLPSDKLQSDIRPMFNPIPTVPISILLAVIQLVFVTLTVVSAYFCMYAEAEVKEKKCKPYIEPFQLNTIVVIAKVFLWIIHVINERFVQYHHTKIRNHGYLNLYRSTKHLKRLPFIVLSTGNTAILVIVSVQDSFENSGHLYISLILSVLILELILSLTYLLIYAGKIYRFNSSKPRPDIIEEENLNMYQRNTSPGIGFRDRASLEEVSEKQADTIEYLQRHNAFLSKQILALTSQPIYDG